MGSPESGPSSSGLKKLAAAAATAATLGLAGYFAAEPIAEFTTDDPPAAPSANPPGKPDPKPAVRKAITLAVGIDTSQSLATQIEKVRGPAASFFETTDKLKDGDVVKICRFVEDASCKTYQLPNEKSQLVRDVSGMTATPFGPGARSTFINPAVHQVVDGLQKENGVGVVLTDAIDETPSSQKSPLVLGHAPVTIMVPRAQDLFNAKKVKASLGGEGIETLEVHDGKAFEGVIAGLTEKLLAEAKQAAEKVAENEHKTALEKYDKEKADYDTALEKHENGKREKMEAVKLWKARIKQGTLALIGLGAAGFMSLIALILYLDSRPKLGGYVADVLEDYPQPYRLPESHKALSLKKTFSSLNIGIDDVMLTPTRSGIEHSGRFLRNGIRLGSTSVFWFEKEPTEDDISTCKRSLSS